MDTIERIYNYIQTYTANHKRPPTLDEIAKACGLSGRSHASYWLTKMRRLGLVAWQPGRPRTLEILGKLEDPPACPGRPKEELLGQDISGSAAAGNPKGEVEP